MAKKPNRISEADLLVPTLRKPAPQPNDRMSTSWLTGGLVLPGPATIIRGSVAPTRSR